MIFRTGSGIRRCFTWKFPHVSVSGSLAQAAKFSHRVIQSTDISLRADKPGAVLGGNSVGTKAYEIPALSAGRMSGSGLTV